MKKSIQFLSIIFSVVFLGLIAVLIFKGKLFPSSDYLPNIPETASTPFYTDEEISKLVKNPVSSGNTIETDIKKSIETKQIASQGVDLPGKYSHCKDSLDLSNCILNSPEPISTDNYIYRFKQLLKYQKTLSSAGENVKDKILNEYVNLFANNPSVLFTFVDDPSVDGMIIQCKMNLVENLVNRNLITQASACNNIPEPQVKQFCLSILK